MTSANTTIRTGKRFNRSSSSPSTKTATSTEHTLVNTPASTNTTTSTTAGSIFRAASDKLTAVSRRSSRKLTEHPPTEVTIPMAISPRSRSSSHTHTQIQAYPMLNESAEKEKDISSGTTSPTSNKFVRLKNRKGKRTKKKEPANDPVGNISIRRLYPDRTNHRSFPDDDNDGKEEGEQEEEEEEAEDENDNEDEIRTKTLSGDQLDMPASMIQLGFGEFLHVENVDLFELDRQHTTANDTEDEEEAFERELEEERRLGLDSLYRDVGRILYLDMPAAQTLLSSIILILVQEGPMLDRSLPPEQQSEEAKARLEALAHSISVSVECVHRVSRSWPHVGIWLVTKAFDVWIGRL